MASLETLELRIKANAESATSGIDSLKSSLSSLSAEVSKSISGLEKLNAQLRELKSYGTIKMPNLDKIANSNARAVRTATKAVEGFQKPIGKTMKEFASFEKDGTFKSWMYGPRPVPNIINGLGFQKGYETEEERMAKNPQWYYTNDEWRKTVQEAHERIRLKEEEAKVTEKAAEAGKGFKEDNRPLAQNSVVLKDLAEKTYHFSNAEMKAASSSNIFQRAVTATRSVMGTLGEGIKNLTSGFMGMFSRIKRIATTMLIRSALRAIIKDIKEGITNFNEWSKTNNKEYTDAINSMKAKSTELKNSIGAAVAPVIQAAIPVVKALTSAVITALNWVNQLIALLSGKSTWIKATDNVDDYTDSINKAGGAAKDWIASFDELNVMTSGGGGGASNAATDYENMFTTMTEFDDKLKSIAEFVKKNAEDIKQLAVDAGAAFLAWKVSTAFSGVLSTISGLVAAGIVIGITWKMTAMLDKQYLKTGEDGWLIADVLTNFLGATIAGKIVKTVLGGGAGLVTAGFSLLISGAISYGIAVANSDNSKADTLKTIGVIKGVIGDLLIGAGFAVATGSMTAGVAAAAMAAPLFFIAAGIVCTIVKAQNAQELAKEVFGNAGQGGISVEEIYSELQKEFDNIAEPYKLSITAFADSQSAANDLETAAQTLVKLKALITDPDQALTLEQAEEFKTAWQTVYEAFQTKSADEWTAIFEGFNAAMTAQTEELKKRAKEQRILALEIQDNLSEIEATLIEETNTLVEKIMKNTASDKEIEQYQSRLRAMGVAVDETVSTFKTIIDSATKIDFSGAEDSVAAAKEFIQNATTAYDETIASIDSGLESQISALEEKKKEIDRFVSEGIIDKETADAWKTNLDNFAQTFKDAAEEKKETVANELLESFKLVMNTAKEGFSQYMDENGIVDVEKASDYVDYVLKPIIEEMANSGVDINSILSEVFTFSEDLSDYLDYEDMSAFWQFVWGEMSRVAEETGQALDPSKIVPSTMLADWDEGDDFKKAVVDYLKERLGIDSAVAMLKDYYNLDINDMISINGWDTMSTAEREELTNALYKAYGTTETIIAIKKAIPDISATDILNMTDYSEFSDEQQTALMKALLDAFGVSSVSAIAAEFPDISVKEILDLTDWDSFTNQEKLMFLQAIKKSFGSEEAKKVAQENGADIGELVASGMESKDPEIQIAAHEWNSIIDDEVTKPHIVQLDTNIAKNGANALAGFISGINPKMEVNASYDKQKTTATAEEMKGIFTGSSPKLTVTATYDEGKEKNLANEISGIFSGKKPVMNVTATYDKGAAEFGAKALAGIFSGMGASMTVQPQMASDAKSSIQTQLNNMGTFSVKVSGYVYGIGDSLAAAIKAALQRIGIKLRAGGGLVGSGDLFVANENGVPELIGRIGNHTGVANNEQMVEAMARGVEYAQAEQNRILLEQNTLLRGILQKEGNVRFGASAALGRTVKQSLDMYDGLTGG